MTDNQGHRATPRIAAAALFYLALAVATTWPVIAGLDRYVISEHLDVSTAFYNLWWFHQAACVLHTTPWTNPLMDYPHGFSMALFPVWIPYDTLALPVIVKMGADGLPVAFNLITILSFTLCGLAGYVLARYLTRQPGAALVAGAALAFFPYRFWNMTRVHAACIEFSVFAVYFFLRMVREKRRGPMIGFVISVCLLMYTSPPLTADTALALALILIFMSLSESEKVFRAATLKRLFMSAAIIAIICAPYLIRVGTEMIDQPVPIAQPGGLRVKYSANLAGFVLPGWNLTSYSRLAPHLTDRATDLARPHGTMGFEVFLGYMVLLLAAIGIGTQSRKAAMFSMIALAFVALSMGPAVHAGPNTFATTSPYQWVEPLLPWLKFERAPVRHLAVALIGVSMLAALGLAAIGRRLTPGKRKAAYLIAGACVLLEFNQAPLELDRFPLPAFVAEIKADPVMGSVLDLPQLPDIKRISGFYHMHHGRPVVFQLASRGDDPGFKKTALARFLDRPAAWDRMSRPERERALKELKAEFSRRKIRYVIAYPKFMTADDAAAIRKIMTAIGPDKVLVEDPVHMVYRFKVE